MPGKLLTGDDLASLGRQALCAAEPRETVAELIAAVDEGRLADPSDDAYALSLAAEILENVGDLGGALPVAERAAALAEVRGSRFGYARALYGELLLRSGRHDDGLAVLSGLRGMMSRDEDAVYYVSVALEQAGRADVALEWLTAALQTALRRRVAVAGQRGTEAYQQAAVVAFALAQTRHRLRRDLDLPHDEDDLLADQLREAAEKVVADAGDAAVGSAVLFWPRDQFAALLLAWPEMAGLYGATWDEHRAQTEQGLHELSASGEARLAVFDGHVEELSAYVERHGGQPSDSDVRQGYVEHREDVDAVRRLWPPQRNQSCWCGSGQKYKKCCLPRSRS